MQYHQAPVKAKSDAFVFSSDLNDWLPKIHIRRAEDKTRHKHKRTLIDVRSKRNHTKDLNNLM